MNRQEEEQARYWMTVTFVRSCGPGVGRMYRHLRPSAHVAAAANGLLARLAVKP